MVTRSEISQTKLGIISQSSVKLRVKGSICHSFLGNYLPIFTVNIFLNRSDWSNTN